MKWLFLSFCFFCFSALAEVVCKSPDNVGGDKESEAAYVPQECLSTATNGSDQVRDDVNVASTKELLVNTNVVKPSQPQGEGSGSGNNGTVK